MLAARGETLDAVIALEVDDAALIERISGRYTCSACGTGYHDSFKQPTAAGVCDKCGSTAFTRRADDSREVVVARLDAYNRLTAPLLPHYRAHGRLFTVNGMLPIDEVTAQIMEILEGLPKQASQAAALAQT